MNHQGAASSKWLQICCVGFHSAHLKPWLRKSGMYMITQTSQGRKQVASARDSSQQRPIPAFCAENTLWSAENTIYKREVMSKDFMGFQMNFLEQMMDAWRLCDTGHPPARIQGKLECPWTYEDKPWHKSVKGTFSLSQMPWATSQPLTSFPRSAFSKRLVTLVTSDNKDLSS